MVSCDTARFGFRHHHHPVRGLRGVRPGWQCPAYQPRGDLSRRRFEPTCFTRPRRAGSRTTPSSHCAGWLRSFSSSATGGRTLVALDVADQLLYPLLFTHLDEAALNGGAGFLQPDRPAPPGGSMTSGAGSMRSTAWTSDPETGGQQGAAGRHRRVGARQRAGSRELRCGQGRSAGRCRLHDGRRRVGRKRPRLLPTLGVPMKRTSPRYRHHASSASSVSTSRRASRTAPSSRP